MKWCKILSGVPQGSVLRPVLLYDLDNEIQNWILKFADDTNVFGVNNNESDSRRLQEDFSKLFQWSEDWPMLFSIKKCKVSHIRRRNQQCKYYTNSQELEVVSEEEDLGVTFTNDLKL